MPPKATATRIRGFHVRNNKTSPHLSEETEAYSCEIWRGDEKVGDAHNRGGGGADVIFVHQPHRKDWDALVAEYAQKPNGRKANGEPSFIFEPDAWMVNLLREALATERSLARKKNAQSALLAHAFEPDDYRPEDIALTRYSLMSPQPVIDVDRIEDDLVWILPIGTDSDDLLRITEPPPAL